VLAFEMSGRSEVRSTGGFHDRNFGVENRIPLRLDRLHVDGGKWFEKSRLPKRTCGWTARAFIAVYAF
tara:strand:- start:102 stop:305 length:204 start_codon:yes stop_codon:yes gene_type:complete